MLRRRSVPFLYLLGLASLPLPVCATSEVIILGPGVTVAAADSKEVVSSYLVNGNTLTEARNICKLRRVGSSVALASGFVQANDFYALDAIRELGRGGPSVDELAARIVDALPARLAPALQAARNAGDETLRRALHDQDALEVAIIGMRDGAPAVIVIAFQAIADDAGNIRISSRRQRCPGDCAAGTVSFFLGSHEAIDQAIADDASLTAAATLSAAAYLNNLEYRSRPDVVGGPQTLLRADSQGVRIVEPGACTREDLEEPVVKSLAPGRLREELDRRLSATANLLCHESMIRLKLARGHVEQDRVEADLRVAYSREFYSNIRMAGRLYQSLTEVPGSWARGSLMTMVRATRTLLSSETVSVRGRVVAGAEEQIGLEFTGGASDRLWSLWVGGEWYPMAFTGTAWFSTETSELRQIEWRTTQAVQPARLNVKEIVWVVNFSTVMVAGEPFPAPADSSYNVRYAAWTQREDMVRSTYSNFQRFDATAKLIVE